MKRWLIGAVCVTLLVSLSTSWQSWTRNTGLATVTTLPLYFSAIWASYLLWIVIACLIFRWQQKVPMFSAAQPRWWLVHLGLSAATGFTHLIIDTFFLWAALSQNFNYLSGVTEKVLHWLPYEILAYWACLSGITLMSNRTTLFGDGSKNYLDRISYKSEHETRLIPVERIDYIEACDNYVKVWSGEDRELIKLTMAHLEKKLDPSQFMRIHRSFIVNLNSLAKIDRQDSSPYVVLNHGKSIPISRRRRSDLSKLLSNSE